MHVNENANAESFHLPAFALVVGGRSLLKQKRVILVLYPTGFMRHVRGAADGSFYKWLATLGSPSVDGRRRRRRRRSAVMMADERFDFGLYIDYE